MKDYEIGEEVPAIIRDGYIRIRGYKSMEIIFSGNWGAITRTKQIRTINYLIRWEREKERLYIEIIDRIKGRLTEKRKKFWMETIIRNDTGKIEGQFIRRNLVTNKPSLVTKYNQEEHDPFYQKFKGGDEE